MNPRTETLLAGLISGITLVLAAPYVQCLGDDTFIYMRVIENFLDSGRIEYNVGHPAYLVTSTTWFFIWTAFTRLLGDIDAARYLLSALFHLSAVGSTWLVAKRLIWNPRLRLVAISIAFLDPFYMRWLWAGWETGMKITMASLGLWALLRLRASSRNLAFLLAGLIGGAATLTRPELVVLAGLGAIYLHVQFRGRRAGLGLYYLGLGSLTLPWMVYAQAAFGWAVPHTVFALSGSPVDTHYIATSGAKFLKILGAPQLATFMILSLALAWRFGISRGRASEEGRTTHELAPWFLVATWAAASAGYLISGSYIASIYTGLFVPSITLAVVSGAERIARGGADQWFRSRAVVASLALALVVSTGIQAKLFYRYSIVNEAYRGGVDQRFIEFARQVNAMTEPDAEVGLWELGVIGYYSERYIIDFAGLATPEIVTYMRRHGDDYATRFLQDRGRWPRYIVRQYSGDSEAQAASRTREIFGARYEPILSQQVQRVGGSRSDGQLDLFVLYRILEGQHPDPRAGN